jgi:hypothetical protein
VRKPTSASVSRPITNQGQRRFFLCSGSVTGASVGGGVPPSALAGTGAGTGANADVSLGGGASPSCAPAAASASPKSSAVCQRRAGSFASAAITTDSSAGCTSGRIWEIGMGGSDRCLSAIDTALSPSNGSRPASIS